jgi:hypothetical protein
MNDIAEVMSRVGQRHGKDPPGVGDLSNFTGCTHLRSDDDMCRGSLEVDKKKSLNLWGWAKRGGRLKFWVGVDDPTAGLQSYLSVDWGMKA